MKLKKRAICSLVLPFTTIELLKFAYLVILRELLCYHFLRITQLQFYYADATEALSRSRLNMTSFSTFVNNTVDSSDRLVGRVATNRLSVLVNVLP